jgi:hypothetical protein
LNASGHFFKFYLAFVFTGVVNYSIQIVLIHVSCPERTLADIQVLQHSLLLSKGIKWDIARTKNNIKEA